MAAIDLQGNEIVETLLLGELAWRAFPTADNCYVIVPNIGNLTVSIASTETLEEGAAPRGAIDMTGVHVGWFEATRLTRTGRKIDLIRAKSGIISAEPRQQGDGPQTAGRYPGWRESRRRNPAKRNRHGQLERFSDKTFTTFNSSKCYSRCRSGCRRWTIRCLRSIRLSSL
jgi:hypothetical protein